MKKKLFLVIFVIFPAAGNNNNKYIYIYIYIYIRKNEKKKCAEKFKWPTAHLYCKKNIVLQGGIVMLQYNHCIASWEGWKAGCITIQ